MEFTTAEKIKIIAKKRNVTMTELAKLTEQSQQNLNNKLRRNNLQENEIQKIAEALNCNYINKFELKDTNETL